MELVPIVYRVLAEIERSPIDAQLLQMEEAENAVLGMAHPRRRKRRHMRAVLDAMIEWASLLVSELVPNLEYAWRKSMQRKMEKMEKDLEELEERIAAESESEEYIAARSAMLDDFQEYVALSHEEYMKEEQAVIEAMSRIFPKLSLLSSIDLGKSKLLYYAMMASYKQIHAIPLVWDSIDNNYPNEQFFRGNPLNESIQSRMLIVSVSTSIVRPLARAFSKSDAHRNTIPGSTMPRYDDITAVDGISQFSDEEVKTYALGFVNGLVEVFQNITVVYHLNIFQHKNPYASRNTIRKKAAEYRASDFTKNTTRNVVNALRLLVITAVDTFLKSKERFLVETGSVPDDVRDTEQLARVLNVIAKTDVDDVV